MKEIQEKAIRIALQCYGNGCLGDEDFIDLLKAILYQDDNRFPNSLINTPGILTTPRDIANPAKNPGDVWVTYTNNENSNTSINKNANAKDIKISDYTKQTIFKD